MDIKRLLPAAPLPCSSQYLHASQPYYIVAPAYDHRSAGKRLLHELCSLLNQLGFEAHLQSPSLSGQHWTSQLTEPIQLAHYRAGKKPIVIYPEVTKGTPLQLGLPVRYVLNFPGYLDDGDKRYGSDELVYTYHRVFYPNPDAPLLRLPTIDVSSTQHGALEPSQRTQIAYYHHRYSAAGGKMRDFGPDALEISHSTPATHAETLGLLKKARLLYTYEMSALIAEALLCGCAVVMLPNPLTLPEKKHLLEIDDMQGVSWGDDPHGIERALATVHLGRAQVLGLFEGWLEQLQAFIERTQTAASALPFERAWPQATIDRLPGAYTQAADLAARADRLHWQAVHKQYAQWRQRSTLREIDAEIYAEHLASGRVQPLNVLIDQRGANTDALADTLDSLGQCLGQPAALHIVAHEPAPAALADAPGVVWHQLAAGGSLAALELPSAWTLLLRSGTQLSPQALMEWGLAPAQFPQARLIYADEDQAHPNEQQRYPFFKPDANVELLRCINYLGPAVALHTHTWQQLGAPLPGAELYAAALALLQQHGRAGLGHISTVLAHAALGASSAAEEAREFDAAAALLVPTVATRLQPLPRLGTWLPEHALQGQPLVSLVVPSGLQTGYLRCLLQATAKLDDLPLHEVIVVCQQAQADEVARACAGAVSVPLHCITLPDGEYQHAAALNAGVARASGEFVLVCDDDTEALHAGWLARLVAIAQQSDVGLVAPRLLSSKERDPKVVGGPVFLGIQGLAASYCGEQQWLDEAGVYSRLQLTQDCSAVAGHCFVLRKAHWERVGGLRAERYPLYLPVLDLCLRLGALGLRHVWTPLSNWVHHGGKTLEQRRHDIHDRVRLMDQELAERQQMLADWAAELAHDPNYNRQLSLLKPFDIEDHIVIDWNPQRRDRPRVLALPLRSGAGQYRVVEPLNALQDAGLVQSCVVMPMPKGASRVLQPLELRRAEPDLLVLQHSVDDAQLSQVRHFKSAAPSIPIVQMVDDLLGEVPEKHPHRVFQSREGHQRMLQALRASDRLIVTTAALQQHYGQYLSDVRLVPNSLDRQWFGLEPKRNPPGARLRVGWVGAGQHQGDLELIEPIVAEFAHEVDWVFMGMCTDGIRPHLKEFHPFVSIADYPAKMASLGLDIAIAPLEDNLFNRCKSNLRLLEYGAMGWAVACSDVATYRTDAPPVLHCASLDDWRTALRHLIDQPDERARLGEALQQWVRRHYALRGLQQRWFEALFAASPTNPQDNA